MLSLLACAAVSVAFGDFILTKSDDSIRVSRGPFQNELRFPGALTTLPVVSPNGKRLLIGHNEQLTCFTEECQRAWTISGLEYMTSPQSLVAGEDLIVFYNGPRVIPAAQTVQEYKDLHKELALIEARYYNGTVAWRKAWMDIGLPKYRFSNSCFIAVRGTDDKAALDNIVFRIIDAKGSRKRGWVISRTEAKGVALTNISQNLYHYRLPYDREILITRGRMGESFAHSNNAFPICSIDWHIINSQL